MKRLRLKWYVRLLLPLFMGLIVFLFIYVNINSILNVFLEKTFDFFFFKNIFLANKILLFIVILNCFFFAILYLFKNTRDVLLARFLSEKDYYSFVVQNFLARNKDLFSSYEFEKRLKETRLISLRKYVVIFLMILVALSFFSFNNFKIFSNSSTYDSYLDKFGIKLNKDIFIEGDSIIAFTNTKSDAVFLELGSNIVSLNQEKVFLGFANPDVNEIKIRIHDFFRTRSLNIKNKPRLKDIEVLVNYNNVVKKRYSNLFDIVAFKGSQISLNANILHSDVLKIQEKFDLYTDTVIVFRYCNVFQCDSFQVFLKVEEVKSPVISFTRVNNYYEILINDEYGLKNVSINNENEIIKNSSKNIEIKLDTNYSYKIYAKNIFDKISVLEISSFLTEISNTSAENSSVFNRVLNYIESELSDISKAINADQSSFDAKDLLQRVLQLISAIDNSNIPIENVKINELQKILEEIKKIIENEAKNSSQNDLIRELNINKLKNTLNRYLKERKENNRNSDSSDENSISNSDQLSFEYMLLITNSLSLDIESKKFRNTTDVYVNSTLPVLLDTLKSIIDKKEFFRKMLVSDYSSVRLMLNERNQDLNQLTYRLNNISVIIYNILKSIEMQMNANQENNNDKKDDSNCLNPNSGNKKKPGISELIGNDGSETDNESDNKSNKNNNRSRENDSNIKEDKEGKEKGNNNEKNGKQGGNNGNESFEDLEKKLKDLSSRNYNNNLEEIRRKIKWLDNSRADRLNEETDDKRKGNFVLENENTENKLNIQRRQILIIQRQQLNTKNNVLY